MKQNLSAQSMELFQCYEKIKLLKRGQIGIENIFERKNYKLFKFTDKNNPLGSQKGVNFG